MGSTLPTQVAALALRSVLRTVRQPAVIISALLFPMMFFSINAYGLDAAARIPGFPADSYLDFAFAFPLIQASLFGAITAGADLARDIETGFFDRLKLTPMRPVALLLGMLAGILALGLLQGVVFLAVGTLMGVDVRSGFLGMVVIVFLMMLVALGFGGTGAILPPRPGSVKALRGAFRLLARSLGMLAGILGFGLLQELVFSAVGTLRGLELGAAFRGWVLLFFF